MKIQSISIQIILSTFPYPVNIPGTVKKELGRNPILEDKPRVNKQNKDRRPNWSLREDNTKLEIETSAEFK